MFISLATSVAGIPVQKFVTELTTVLATVAVTDHVTAVDTDAIGMVLMAGAPLLIALAIGASLWHNSWSVCMRDIIVSCFTSVAHHDGGGIVIFSIAVTTSWIHVSVAKSFAMSVSSFVFPLSHTEIAESCFSSVAGLIHTCLSFTFHGLGIPVIIVAG